MPVRVRPLVALLALVAAAAEPSPDRKGTVDRLKKDLTYLAGDECNGRGSGTPGIDKAADYVAAQFKEAGLKPAGEKGGYFQPFTIATGARVGTPNGVSVTGPGGQKLALEYQKQFMPLAESGSATAAGGLVFVGYGIASDKPAYDDYAGVDVKGKVVVILRKTPRAGGKENPFDTDDGAILAARSTKVETAVKKGAAGVIFVNDRGEGGGRDVLQDYRRPSGDAPAKIPVVHAKRSFLDVLLSSTGVTLAEAEDKIDKDLKPQSRALKGWEAAMQVTLDRGGIACKNVVGVLPGAGPLADETIVLGAHYDHLGTSSYGSLAGAAAEGKVHYGADDNGSGTTGLIELARRLGAAKDRQGRRIVFVAFSGEERGLFGSKHYVSAPPFPLDKTVFMLNLDMIGRSKPVEDKNENGKEKDRLVANGLGTGEGFEKLVDEAAKAVGGFTLFKVQTGTGPSDHDSFYRKKIPVLFFYTGTHPDYHRPTDTVDKINFPAMAKVVDLCEKLAAHFAAADKPKLLTPAGGWVDPTEAPRRPQGPRLGLMPSYEEGNAGMLVDDVSPGGAAEKAGIKKGDLVVEIAGKPVKSVEAYMDAMRGQKAGEEMELAVLRDGKKVTLKATPR